MELKRINREPAASDVTADLQHEVVRKVESRYEAERRQQQKLRRAQRLKSLLSLLFFLAILSGLAYFVWFRWFNDGGAGPVADLVRNIFPATTAAGSSTDSETTVGTSVPSASAAAGAQTVENLSAYMEMEKSFTGLSLDYWKNAPAADRPNKAQEPLTFICLVKPSADVRDYYELTTAPGRPMAVRRLLPTSGWTDYPLADFRKLMAGHPLLLKRANRVYLCSPTKGKTKAVPRIADKDTSFACGQSDFGELYDVVVTQGFATPQFVYDVSFRPAATKTVIKIGVFPLGTTLTRKDFVAAAARVNLPDIVVNGAEILVSVKAKDK